MAYDTIWMGEKRLPPVRWKNKTFSRNLFFPNCYWIQMCAFGTNRGKKYHIPSPRSLYSSLLYPSLPQILATTIFTNSLFFWIGVFWISQSAKTNIRDNKKNIRCSHTVVWDLIWIDATRTQTCLWQEGLLELLPTDEFLSLPIHRMHLQSVKTWINPNKTKTIFRTENLENERIGNRKSLFKNGKMPIYYNNYIFENTNPCLVTGKLLFKNGKMPICYNIFSMLNARFGYWKITENFDSQFAILEAQITYGIIFWYYLMRKQERTSKNEEITHFLMSSPLTLELCSNRVFSFTSIHLPLYCIHP